MIDFLTSNFYWIDFTIAVFIFVIVVLLYKFKKIDKYFWYLYWLGVLIGLTWELPMSIANEIGIYPPAHFIVPLPTHFSVIVITHSLWDGGLFLFGVWLVLIVCKKSQFEKFSYRELIVMLIWGQLSELSVELISTFSNAWEFIKYWWNPVLFVFNGHNITLLPQLIWLFAPIVFYIIAIKIKRRVAH